MNNTKKAKKLLVIDDDEIFHFSVRRLNKRTEAFHEVNLFLNAETALQHLKTLVQQCEELPEVILLDINMPLMNGWEFLRAYASLELNTPCTEVYIVSSSIDRRDVEKAGQHPMIKGYLQKPLAADALSKLGNNCSIT